MGTEILNPQDCLTERARIIGGGGPRWRSHRKRGAQSGFAKNTTTTNNDNNNLVLGQVVILKRGESLDLKRRTGNSAKKSGSSASVPKQIRVGDRCSSGDEYAGTAFFLSPSPRALPLPSFSKKKQSAESVVHDSATKDLRRLLRLD